MSGPAQAPAPAPENQPRSSINTASRVTELERVVRALLKAIKEAEEISGDPLMPTGEYFGVKFE